MSAALEARRSLDFAHIARTVRQAANVKADEPANAIAIIGALLGTDAIRILPARVLSSDLIFHTAAGWRIFMHKARSGRGALADTHARALAFARSSAEPRAMRRRRAARSGVARRSSSASVACARPGAG